MDKKITIQRLHHYCCTIKFYYKEEPWYRFIVSWGIEGVVCLHEFT
jgi:hypothetical protein